MTHKTQTLKIQRAVNATPAAAYRAFTSALALREWLCNDAQVEARKGGRLYAWWDSGYYAAGQFFAANPDKKLAFTWRGRGEPESTQVQITFTPRTGGGATVAVIHSGIWSGRQWAEAVAEFKKGWEVALANLQSVLETGQDLRFVRRPMLGISLGDFNSATAARLGVPVNEGALVESALPGMGAHAAGLQKNDVIVSLGRSKVRSWNSLGPILQNYQGGDRVVVTFYRGPEKLTATMELSRRPLPEIPPTAAELAEAVRQTYAKVDAALAECFAGATDAEASAKPAPAEWSAKETLAHLLTGEHDQQHWIAALVMRQDVPEFLDNLDARYSAVASVYTLPAMLAALKQAEAETAALVAALPPEFVERKASYWRLAYNTLQPLYHLDGHIDQMRAALEAAREKVGAVK